MNPWSVRRPGVGVGGWVPLTERGVGQAVHLQDEVVLEEDIAHDGEEVDQDEGQHGRQHDGAPVARHALDHVQQRLLAVHQVEQLQVMLGYVR